MTLTDIYAQFTTGSQGFVNAVQTHCGFEASNAEIERIAVKANSAEAFQNTWENDDSWADKNNAAQAD